MICPACASTSIIGPVARESRGGAAMRCTRCATTFDAYDLFGSSARPAAATGVAA